MLKVRAKTMLPPRFNDTKLPITLLAKLFEKDWEENLRILTFLTSIDWYDIANMGLNLIFILTNILYKGSIIGPEDFVYLTQLDINEVKIY